MAMSFGHAQIRPVQLVVVILLVLLPHGTLQAQVTTRQEIRSDKRVLVMENQHARVAVLPDPGGTVIEFLDKKTNTDYVAGGSRVLAGRLGFGWKDYHWLEAPEAMGRSIFTLPYEAKFTSGPGYHGIHVSLEAEGRRFEREMRLAGDTAVLTTLVRVTNISQAPLRLQARWHTYCTLNDVKAENACILAPGLGGQARKVFIGTGYDHQFFTADPYWLAVNYKDGSGLWMTFNKQHSPMQITWTDYRYTRPGADRGMFVMEPMPVAVLAQPGESVVYDSTIYPFTVSDTAQTMPMGMLSDAAVQARARQFLSDTLPNLAAIGPYTMTVGAPPAGQARLDIPNADNRFEFSGRRRRDRFALRSWGMLDAMLSVPGVQDQPSRVRYYARLFDSADIARKVSFRLRVMDAADAVALEQTKSFVLEPGSGREVDARDDVALAALPDGWYRFILEGFVEGEKEPIHSYTETRHLVGQARAQEEAKLKSFEDGPLQVRPFVQALYEQSWVTPAPGHVAIPIGVEEGGGVARANWPVRCGVPFAQGMVDKDASLELVAPDGQQINVATSPMATWLDGSIKWLRIDFNASVPGNGHVFYMLKGARQPGGNRPLLARLGNDGPTIEGLDFKLGSGRLFGLLRLEDLWWQNGHDPCHQWKLALLVQPHRGAGPHVSRHAGPGLQTSCGSAVEHTVLSGQEHMVG